MIDLPTFERRFADYLVHLGDVDASVLLGAVTPEWIEPGESPIRFGEPHDSLYFVNVGVLVVTVPTEGGTAEVGRVAVGGVVGEVGLLNPGNATATVTAEARTEVLGLSSAALDALWIERPNVASAVVQGLLHIMSERLRRLEGDVDRHLAAPEPEGITQLLGRLFGRTRA